MEDLHPVRFDEITHASGVDVGSVATLCRNRMHLKVADAETLVGRG
jgi:hypothetical protein